MLDDDELPLDNEVRLEPPGQRRVRVDLHVLDRRLRDPLKKAISAAANAVVGDRDPEVVFTDRATRPAVGPGTWVVYLLSEKGQAIIAAQGLVPLVEPLAAVPAPR